MRSCSGEPVSHGAMPASGKAIRAVRGCASARRRLHRSVLACRWLHVPLYQVGYVPLFSLSMTRRARGRRSDDSAIPLDKYVFNTEAHPLKIWS